MPNLDQIISVQISRETKGVSQVGFGTPMILGSSNRMGANLIRTYFDMKGVAADFQVLDLEYVAANSIFSQEQTPDQIKIGYKAAATAMATGLSAISAIDDEWYCLLLTSRVGQDILDAATFIESKEKILIACSSDLVTATSATTDIAAELKLLGFSRTATLFSTTSATYPEAAWAGLCLPFDPGSETWKFKSLHGSAPDSLSPTESTAAKSKNANTYETYAGVSITGEGVMADGEFIDVIRFTDWLKSRIQERIFAKLTNSKKIPYTDKGAAVIEAEIRAQLLAGVAIGGLVEGSIQVDVPKVIDQNPNDRAARFMPHFTFAATLSGAIHKIQIKGTVSV